MKHFFFIKHPSINQRRHVNRFLAIASVVSLALIAIIICLELPLRSEYAMVVVQKKRLAHLNCPLDATRLAALQEEEKTLQKKLSKLATGKPKDPLMMLKNLQSVPAPVQLDYFSYDGKTIELKLNTSDQRVLFTAIAALQDKEETAGLGLVNIEHTPERTFARLHGTFALS